MLKFYEQLLCALKKIQKFERTLGAEIADTLHFTAFIFLLNYNIFQQNI